MTTTPREADIGAVRDDGRLERLDRGEKQLRGSRQIRDAIALQTVFRLDYLDAVPQCRRRGVGFDVDCA